jgi:hypothetical protein
MTKAQQRERDEAIAQLREWIKPGDTVYTILDHVSASGMSRAIRVLVPQIHAKNGDLNPDLPSANYTTEFIHPNWAVGKALGLRHWKRHGREQDALVVGGCGMDMGFHLVYELSHALYGSRSCPARTCDPRSANNPKDCPHCHGTGMIGGYACLGKGKCPSNYHTNYRLSDGEGPERFDLIHTDGYALRQRWL